ncbi:MAG: hypothetical protein ABIQ40_10925 [Bacteroidia bacterium]
MNYDFRKYRCNKSKCIAELPEVYCSRVAIKRRELPHFIMLLSALKDPILSYHVLAFERQDDREPEFDTTWIFIWVNPEKHFYPDVLVSGGANLACNYYTIQQEIEFFAERKNTEHDNIYREHNCPVCSKNWPQGNSWVMTLKQYNDSLATFINGKK